MRHAELVEQREDRVIDSLHRSLAREKRSSLTRGMYFPVGWDPYFVEFITLEDVEHYPTQHYDHHRRQLTFGRGPRG